MELFNNISWEALALLATLFLGIPGLIIGFLSYKRKVLSYHIASEGLIYNTDKKGLLGSKLEIKYDGKQITNIWLYNIEFSNSGNVPIEMEDFNSQISIVFVKGNIVSSSYGKRDPRDLGVHFTHTNKSATIQPLLLNKRDRFSIRILVDQEQEETPQIIGRISGTEVKEKNKIVKLLSDNTGGQPFWFTIVLNILALVLFILMFKRK